jgi:NAD(P)-dependent dehydrogenase (short-subunit alcohol dehydrogenase family)
MDRAAKPPQAGAHMPIRFDGRVAVITGAGGGLGRAHALMLASRGAAVVVNDMGGALDGRGSSHSAADAVVEAIVRTGGKACANYDSVTDPEGAPSIVATALERFGRLDILVNNAGFLRDKTFAKSAIDDFRAVLEVHLMGAVLCTHAAWPAMKDQGYGRIVMTSSGAGIWGNFGQSNYGAAKMALVGLMNVLKLEGQRNNILVNAVSPIAATRMTESLMPKSALPYLKPEFVAAAVAYLCSEACKVSGHVISAGAGYYARSQMMESQGVLMDPTQPADPDAVAAAYERITELSNAVPLYSAPDLMAKSLGRFESAAAG